ncbi:Fungalysin metallopeptidase-domain-containing protein [Schizophyllum amplum]|uniref:Extracellular metalloproteinase n=1 Tax=Schizophyllum amplum TaxID=97359 RepID=A0A550CGZ1_9AGAR|nr:Fungalysin metallopeptidase-domain-containing protein [Auriculariopsis ampla]
MFSFDRFSTTVVLALACSSVTGATPWVSPSSYSTHRIHQIGRSFTVESYHPPTTYKTFGEGLDDDHAARVRRDGIESTSVAFVAAQIGVDEAAVDFRSGYEGASGHFGYLRQTHVCVNNIAPSTPSVDIDSFISEVEAQLGGNFNDHSSFEYLARADGSVALVHVVQIRNEDTNAWYEAIVDAHSGELVSVTDFVADAAYTVVPINHQDPTQGLQTIYDPANIATSPYGWHGDGSGFESNDTSGNNVFAYSLVSGTALQSAEDLSFDYAYDIDAAPTDDDNVKAATVNAFYAFNTLHDVSYVYGFTESAFNFQLRNFDKGGAEGDRIPNVDGDVQNDFLIHEGAHGIVGRLTGGGTGRCVSTFEAAGLSEGWSDAMAEWIHWDSNAVTDFVIGAFATGNPNGLRRYPYSVSNVTNPLRYSSVTHLFEVHNVGEVWANMLHGVYLTLVSWDGWDADFKTNAASDAGNVVFMHLYMDGLALQPCNPTFIDARDAFIQADVNRYAGRHFCLLWHSFATRGLGLKAANYIDESSVPARCRPAITA